MKDVYQVKIEDSSWIKVEATSVHHAMEKVVDEWDASRGLPIRSDGTTKIEVKHGESTFKFKRVAGNEVKYKLD